MKKSIRTPVLLLMLLLLTALLLTGCDKVINNGMHRTECEAYLNAMLAGDFEAAHAITPTLDKEEHRAYFEKNCQLIQGATSYTLTQTGWNSNYSDGVATQTAAYEIVTDNGVTCQFLLRTTDGYEGISYINFRDSSEFIRSSQWVKKANALSALISLPLLAFYIWMIVDSIRRKMPKKGGWIFLTLLTASFTFTIGGGSVNTQFMASIIDTFVSVKASVPDELIIWDISLPIGALIYFFNRKKLSAKYEAAQQAKIAPDPVAAPLTVADLTKTEESPAEAGNAKE